MGGSANFVPTVGTILPMGKCRAHGGHNVPTVGTFQMTAHENWEKPRGLVGKKLAKWRPWAGFFVGFQTCHHGVT